MLNTFYIFFPLSIWFQSAGYLPFNLVKQENLLFTSFQQTIFCPPRPWGFYSIYFYSDQIDKKKKPSRVSFRLTFSRILLHVCIDILIDLLVSIHCTSIAAIPVASRSDWTAGDGGIYKRQLDIFVEYSFFKYYIGGSIELCEKSLEVPRGTSAIARNCPCYIWFFFITEPRTIPRGTPRLFSQ